MTLARHLEIGAAALERGFIEARELARFVAELIDVDGGIDGSGDGGGGAGVDAWRRVLSEHQLAEILALLAATREARKTAEGSAATVFQHRSVVATAVLGGETRPGEITLVDPPAGPPIVPRGSERYAELAMRGEGGMGAVIECMDRDLGRRVALKHLRADFVGDGPAARMLEREARVTGSLEHPNIVPVYDVGATEKGGPFYVMRLVEQPTLSEVLQRLAAGDPQHSAEYTQGRLLRHFIQICETVDYAHSRGVVHCDLKPANILLGHFGEVLVLDWGLAYRVDEGTAYRGGTPGYMAPEQTTRAGTIDARTDVYALGVILFEMLALESHEPTSHTTVVRKPLRVAPRDVRRPSTRAPERGIPAELDDICAKALSDDPAARFASARELAAAVAAFLEGTKERERRQRRADESAGDGDRLAESYHELIESRPERAADVAALRATLLPWEPAERKGELWDAEDALAVTDGLGVRMFQAAAAAYEQALEEVPGHARARRGLARLYQAQLENAARRRDELDRLYFEELVKQYDDGAIQGSLRAEGTLVVGSAVPGVLRVVTVEEHGHRLVPGREVVAGATPVTARLAPGRYQASFLDAAGRSVRFPLEVPAGRALELALDVADRDAPDAGEVLVPAGPALLGDESDGGLRRLEVAAFVMARLPVTFGDYLAFLEDLAAHDAAAAERFLPRTRDGAGFWRVGPAGLEPAPVSNWADDPAALLALPVIGVDSLAAEAYAAWLSARRGRVYRLPTEVEWEKAGRGVDGRRYPWGDRFDASFCKMRQSRPGLPRPEPPGRFEVDESPYGVRDLAGGVADWVTPGASPAAVAEGQAREIVSRGGAWSDFAADCSLAVRRPYLAVERSTRVGFRLVRSVIDSVRPAAARSSR
jgi:serine/threonine-protein kinase